MVSTRDLILRTNDRLSMLRGNLEHLFLPEIETAVLRGRIAELKELLEALNNEASPAWNAASEEVLN